ncbi:uncharacterized protein LOC109076018 [Cyprinus carpio]|uniref:Uncharacterized protein LOC109076018 n=1 Tax=Cyprinus carpio TaxID=7962 RepID=A0A9Q9XYB1_CYPCA|nr:uncharacterized protein LOC109076018 [Cyprinus carpio]
MYMAELREMLKKYLTEERIESTLRRVSRASHPPGSSEGNAVAREILQNLQNLRMDHTWTDSHYATLQFPSRTQPNTLWLVDSEGEELEEIPLDSEGYCAYSARGTATTPDIRYHPHHHCITLNTTLLNEDDNREWRCEVTQRDQVQTSVTYTVKSSAQADSTTAGIPVHSTKSPTTTAVIPVTDSPTAAGITTEVTVTVVCASFVLLLLALILWMMIRKKRSGVRRATDDSVDPSSRAGTNSLFCESQVNLEALHSSPESRQTSPSQVVSPHL